MVRYRMYMDKELMNAYKRQYDKVKIVWMSPSSFLSKSNKYKHVDSFSTSNVNILARKIKDNIELDPLFLRYRNGQLSGVQGRHRAMAAKSLSIKRVPVLILESS